MTRSTTTRTGYLACSASTALTPCWRASAWWTLASPALDDDAEGLDTAEAIYSRLAKALALTGVNQARAAFHEDHMVSVAA